MQKRQIAETALNVLVQLSVGRIVYSAARASNPNPATTKDKVMLGTGSFVLGSMVAERAHDWTNKLVNKTADSIDSARKNAQ